ncbi:hypothetical protein CDD83_9761 [Cordyceps sp. RAO-2017]|nr:hypothetical protein CDD83_9761 [Cordyceps sp. RAO-2017]
MVAAATHAPASKQQSQTAGPGTATRCTLARPLPKIAMKTSDGVSDPTLLAKPAAPLRVGFSAKPAYLMPRALDPSIHDASSPPPPCLASASPRFALAKANSPSPSSPSPSNHTRSVIVVNPHRNGSSGCPSPFPQPTDS